MRIYDRWQFIDTEGKVVIQPLYSQVTDFSYGFADVYLPDTGWQIIDKQGELVYFRKVPSTAYNEAMGLMAEGKYSEAMTLFQSLGDYKDAAAQAQQCADLEYSAPYASAVALMEAGSYKEAAALFGQLNGYRDADDLAASCLAQQKELDYQAAVELMNAGDYQGAYALFSKLKGYKDVDELLANNSALKPTIDPSAIAVGKTMTFGAYEQDNDEQNGKEPIEWQILDVQDNRVLLISINTLDAQPFHTSK